MVNEPSIELGDLEDDLNDEPWWGPQAAMYAALQAIKGTLDSELDGEVGTLSLPLDRTDVLTDIAAIARQNGLTVQPDKNGGWTAILPIPGYVDFDGSPACVRYEAGLGPMTKTPEYLFICYEREIHRSVDRDPALSG